MTTRPCDATNGRHLWAETYDRELNATNIFAVQDEITGQIVNKIADAYGIINVTQMQEVSRTGTKDLGAYECVLRAHEFYRVYFTPENHLEVRNCLEQAVEVDPNYAEAWTWLSGMYRDEKWMGFNPLPNPIERSEQAAQRAIKIQPTNQSAHAFLADVYFDQRDPNKFFEQADRALGINPHSANILGWMGNSIARAGKWQRGAALINKAIALSNEPPGWMFMMLSFGNYRHGEYEAALANGLKNSILGWWLSQLNLAICYGQLGRTSEAKLAADKLVEQFPGFLSNANAEVSKWFWEPVMVESVIDGLRKAGLDIPAEG